MFAVALLLVALAAHAVFVLWARTLIRNPVVTFGLALASVIASLSLFADRSHFGATSFELAIVALGAGLFVAFWLALRGARRLRKKKSPPERKEDEEPKEDEVGRRDVAVAVAGAAAWGTSALVLGWGEVRGRHELELTEHVVKIAGWPKALDGYTLVQISDLHIGKWTTEQDLALGLALVTQARPDLLVVTGDVVDFDASFAPMVASQIMRVAPRDGVLGILGNHDYYAGADDVRHALDSAGIQVLLNDSRRLRVRDGGGFVVLGLDDLSASHHGGRGPDLGQTLAALAGRPGEPAGVSDAPRILLAHQPPQFDEAAGKVALQLSGHTHGYQFGFAAGLGRIAHRYVSGAYEKAGSHLWVNRGFGVTGPPSRVGVRPEVSKIVLVSG